MPSKGDSILEKLSNELYQISLPLPFPLKWVHCYLIRGRHGYTVLDTGLHTEEAELIWDKGLEEAGISYSDIEQIVLTHYHPDHYGMAGWMQQKTAAPVYISETDYRTSQRFFSSDRSFGPKLREHYHKHGMDAQTAEAMVPHMNQFLEWVSPQPNVQFIDETKPFRLGDLEYEVIPTPGHSGGHLCFYQQESKDLFAGDHLLQKISPNISYYPGGAVDPLGQFLESLDKMKTYDIGKVYPAHGPIYDKPGQRILALEQHHHERLEKMISYLNLEKSAFEVCQWMFGTELSVHQMRFAISEVLAHLQYLKIRGHVVEQSDGRGIFRYIAI
jgi:glyoxylase-like metal-dependent hydrolase (beta-lactamase superfamily II)